MSEHSYTEGLQLLDQVLHAAGYCPIGLGRGPEYNSPVFTMNPYTEADCNCGSDDAEALWVNQNPHSPGCFSTLLEEHLDRTDPVDLINQARTFAAAHGVEPQDAFTHCGCGRTAALEAQGFEHQSHCFLVRPNFIHHASGLEVEWYKRIGRSMEVKNPVPLRNWALIMAECLNDVSAAPPGPEPPSHTKTS